MPESTDPSTASADRVDRTVADSVLPKAVWSGTFSLMGTELRCHLLDNGQRVIDADHVERLFARVDNGDVPLPSEDEMNAFIAWMTNGPEGR